MLCITGHAADPQLVLNMLAADQQGPADGLGVLLHSRLSVPVVGKVPDQRLVLGQPVLYALDLRNGSRLGPFDVPHDPDRGQLRFHIHVHRPLLRLEAKGVGRHDGIPASGGHGHQEVFPGRARIDAVGFGKAALYLGDGGRHAELDVRPLFLAHHGAPFHMGNARLGDHGFRAVEEVALIKLRIAVLQRMNGVVGALPAALRGPKHVAILLDAVELRPLVPVKGVSGKNVIPIHGIFPCYPRFDGAEPQLPGLCLALVLEVAQDTLIQRLVFLPVLKVERFAQSDDLGVPLPFSGCRLIHGHRRGLGHLGCACGFPGGRGVGLVAPASAHNAYQHDHETGSRSQKTDGTGEDACGRGPLSGSHTGLLHCFFQSALKRSGHFGK